VRKPACDVALKCALFCSGVSYARGTSQIQLNCSASAVSSLMGEQRFVQVAAKLDQILERSVEFTSMPGKESSRRGRAASHDARADCGRLFSEVAGTEERALVVTWQSEFAEAQQQGLERAAKDGIASRRKRQRLLGSSVRPEAWCR
jgi:hypothetical protein